MIDTVAKEDNIGISEALLARLAVHGENSVDTTFHGMLLVTLQPGYRTFVQFEASLIRLGKVAGLRRQETVCEITSQSHGIGGSPVADSQL